MSTFARASLVVLIAAGVSGCYCETRAGGGGMYGTSGGSQPPGQVEQPPGTVDVPATDQGGGVAAGGANGAVGDSGGGVAATAGGQNAGATAAGTGRIAVRVATVSLTPPAQPTTPTDTVFGSTEPIATGGFTGQIYNLETNTRNLPDFGTLEPVGTIYATRIDIAPRRFEEGFPGVTDRFEWFGVRYVGTLNFPTAGEYRFRINSDDGAKLYIDGHAVVENDGQHAPRSRDGRVTLTQGPHEMVVEYFQGPRFQIALQLYMTPPGGAETIFSVQ